MPKLAESVEYINAKLRASQFGSKRFQKGRWSGIAELIRTPEGEMMPCSVDNDGDATQLGIDDTYPFEVYHRMIGANFENSEDDFGANKGRKEFSDMVIVIMGDRDRLEFTNEEIISGLSLGFPFNMEKTDVEALSLQSVDFSIQGFERDREAVWNREFETERVQLKPNTLLVSLRYQVMAEVFDGCIEICQ